METWVILSIGSAILILGLFVWSQRLVLKTIKTLKPSEKLDHDKLMDILNSTIQREFTYRYKLEYELKDLTMVADFQKDLTELTHAVFNAFSLEFLQRLEAFYSREYIITHVTKTLQIALMEFLREKKIKTK